MKRMLPLLLAALLLTGCSLNSGGAVPSTTSFPLNQTPAQMLQSALEQTQNASSFSLTYTQSDAAAILHTQVTVTMTKNGKGGYVALVEKNCGCAMFISGNTQAALDCQTGEVTRAAQQTDYPLAHILQDLPQGAPGLPQRVSNFPLTASPSNTGTTRFEIGNLDGREMVWVLTGEEGGEAIADFDGCFAMTLDSLGALLAVEYTDPATGMICVITVTNLNQKTQIDTPSWAK